MPSIQSCLLFLPCKWKSTLTRTNTRELFCKDLDQRIAHQLKDNPKNQQRLKERGKKMTGIHCNHKRL